LNNMKFLVFVVFCIVIGFVSCQKTQEEWEAEYLKIPSSSFAYEHLSYYTSLPHVAGTLGDYQTALYTHAKFQEYGLDSRIEEETVLLNYPVSRHVSVVSPANSTYTCVMKEDTEPSDPTSGDPRVIPTFNGYAPTGNVTAEVVYVNYGSIDDFTYLKEQGIELEGKIAIARYGSIFRGVKAMIAQQHGMVGILIYSDPADDGYAKGPVYPEGPWRSNSSVQRGSAQFLSICPGNPARKICALKGQEDTYSYTDVIPAIPVQPLSYGDAFPILKSLGGPTVPSDMAGALPLTYKFGPGPGTVNIDLVMDYVNTTIWNVIAETPVDPNSPVGDEQVLIGNHRDAWVFGAADPNSGTSVLLETARSIGELLRQGYLPQRKIVFCSWDGEEYGLLGSTAFAERHNETLQENALAYLNVDTAITGGSFSVAATPSLISLIYNVTKDVPYPGTKDTLYDNWSKYVAVLGSGSDYTSFLHHFGIPALNLEFDGPYGVYHSEYDSMHWMEMFGDPSFNFYVTLSQAYGLIGLRLSDYNVIPFNYTMYANHIENYQLEIENLADTYDISIDFSSLTNAISSFKTAATSISAEIGKFFFIIM